MPSRKKLPDDWRNETCAGLGEKPRLRDLMDQAKQVWGCTEIDAYLWTERVVKANPSMNFREAKALMQNTINQHRAKTDN